MANTSYMYALQNGKTWEDLIAAVQYGYWQQDLWFAEKTLINEATVTKLVYAAHKIFWV